MSSSNSYAFNVHRGDTFELIAIWKDANGNPISLTGWTARFQARQTAAAAAADVDLTEVPAPAGVVTRVEAEGKVTVRVESAKTAALVEDTYVFDLEITKTADSTVKTLLTGSLIMEADIAR